MQSTGDGKTPKLDEEARAYVAALADEKPGKLSTLRRSTKVGLAAAAFALLALAVGGVARLASDERTSSPRKRVALGSVSAAPAAVAEPVTPEDILRDEAASRKRGMLEAARAHPAQAQASSREEPAGGRGSLGHGGGTLGVSAGRRKPKPPRSGPGSKGSATAASRSVELPEAPANEKATKVRQRKDLANVIRFYEAPPKAAADPKQQRDGNKLGIPTGSTVRARLVNGVTLSGRVRSVPAVAEIATALVFPSAGEVLPRGTRLVGRAQPRVEGDRGRIEVVFSTLVLPDHSERPISAIATMSDGSVGISARVSESDQQHVANLAEGALDLVEDALSSIPGGRAAKRFTADERGDARDLRAPSTTVSVPQGASFVVQFVRSA